MGGGLYMKYSDWSIKTFKPIKSTTNSVPSTILSVLLNLELKNEKTQNITNGNDTILTKLNKLFNNLIHDDNASNDDKTDTQNKIQKLISLFDSRHDFESLMSDRIKKSRDNTQLYQSELAFSLLGKQTMKIESPNNSLYAYGGNLTIQGGKMSGCPSDATLSIQDLENVFILYSLIKKIKKINSGNGVIKVIDSQTLRTIKKDTANANTNYEKLAKEISDFFSDYKHPQSGTGPDKIPLVIDCCISLFSGKKSAQTNAWSKYFYYLFTTSSVNDPSPKKNIIKSNHVEPFTDETVLVEEFDKSKKYTHDDTNSSYEVTLTMKCVDTNGTKVQVNDQNAPKVDITYSRPAVIPGSGGAVGRSFTQALHVGIPAKKNLHNIGHLEKMYRKHVTNYSTEPCDEESKLSTDKKKGPDLVTHFDSMITKLIGNDQNRIKNLYENITGSDDNMEFICKDIETRNEEIFVQKRLGDHLLAQFVNKLNSNDEVAGFKDGVNFMTKNEMLEWDRKSSFTNFKNIKKAILITHERMLFSYALELDIPVVMDYGTYVIMYNPTATTDPTAPAITGSKKSKKRRTKTNSKKKN